MKQRGRRSVASLAVVTPLDTRRPAPPAELTDEQATVWRETVTTMPPDWFGRESFPVLSSYCRHVCRARWLAKKIDAAIIAEIGDPVMLERLFGMAEKEDRAVLTHARSLRLTVQAKYDNRAAGRKAANMLPASYYEMEYGQ